MLSQMFASNPEMKDLLTNPDLMKDMMTPENMQAAMGMMGGGFPGMGGDGSQQMPNPFAGGNPFGMNPFAMGFPGGYDGMPMPVPSDYGEEVEEQLQEEKEVHQKLEEQQHNFVE